VQRICLFLNGSFQLSSFEIEVDNNICKNNILYYAADGGLNHIIKHNFPLTNLCWVGDSDSLNKKSKDFLNKKNSPIKQIIQLNPMKDFSDLAALLDAILAQNFDDTLFIEIYGGLGKRRDHEVANIEEIKRFLSLLPKGGTALFHGGVVITSLPIKISNTNCRFFSAFANTGSIEIAGAWYSGRYSLERPSHGLSNEIRDKVLSITPYDTIVTLYFEDY
jgi:thiamine pyrophosphokinase